MPSSTSTPASIASSTATVVGAARSRRTRRRCASGPSTATEMTTCDAAGDSASRVALTAATIGCAGVAPPSSEGLARRSRASASTSSGFPPLADARSRARSMGAPGSRSRASSVASSGVSGLRCTTAVRGSERRRAMPSAARVLGSARVRRQHEQRHLLVVEAEEEVTEEVDGGGVGPVDVVDEEHGGRGAHVVEHEVGEGEQLAGALALDGVGGGVGGAVERGVGARPLDHREVGVTAACAEGVGHRDEERVAQRQVGEVEVVVAAAAQHRGPSTARVLERLLGESGLADPRLHPRRTPGGRSRRARDRPGRAARPTRPAARSARSPSGERTSRRR